MICQKYGSREIGVPKLILLANFVNLGVLSSKNIGAIFFKVIFSLKFEFQNGRHFPIYNVQYLAVGTR